MACEECKELNTHRFRNADDLVHAFQVAAFELDRGVLQRLTERDNLTVAEEEALRSAFESGALPGAVTYRFRCTVCGDAFELAADMESGQGGWTRAEPEPKEA